MNRIHLRKCPFCGEKPSIEISWNKPKTHGRYGYRAICLNCNYETETFENYTDAVKAWNMNFCNNVRQLNIFNYMESAHE